MRWYSDFRSRLFHSFCVLTKLPEAERFRWYHKAIHWILFPFDTFAYTCLENARVRYDWMRGVIVVGKFQYSVQLLEMGFEPGRYVITINKDKNFFSLERI